MKIVEEGVIHGRFQPLHLGHMEYLLEGKRRCKFLWIGLTNPDPDTTAYSSNNPLRSHLSANPFSYLERFQMVKNALLDAGVARSEFEIVPFPINFPERLKYYVPMGGRFFVTIYDDWNKEKVNILRSLDVDIDVMWVRSTEERITSGTQIRNLIIHQDQWQHLVPLATTKLIYKIGINEIIHRIKSAETYNI